MDIAELRSLAENGEYEAAAKACLSFNDQTEYIKRFRARCLLLAGDLVTFGNLLKKKNNKLDIEIAYYYYRTRKYEEASSFLEALVLNDPSEGDKKLILLLLSQVYQRTSKQKDAAELLTNLLTEFKGKEEEIDILTNIYASAEYINAKPELNKVKKKNSKNDIYELLFNEALFASKTMNNNEMCKELLNNLMDSASYLDEVDNSVENTLLLDLQKAYVQLLDSNIEQAQPIYEKLLSSEANAPDWIKIISAFNLYLCNEDNIKANEAIISYAPMIEQFLQGSIAEKNPMNKLSYSLKEQVCLNYCKWQLNGFKVGPCLNNLTKLYRSFQGVQKDCVLLKARIYLMKSKVSLARQTITKFIETLNTKEEKANLWAEYLEELVGAKQLSKKEINFVIEQLGESKYSQHSVIVARAVEDKQNFYQKALEYHLDRNTTPPIDLCRASLATLLEAEEYTKAMQLLTNLKGLDSDWVNEHFSNELLVCKAFTSPFDAEADISESSLSVSEISINELIDAGMPRTQVVQKSKLSNEEELKRRKERKKQKVKAHRRKKYLEVLKARGIDPVEGERTLDPERWVPFKFRKANQRRRKKDKKLTGAQGIVDEKVAAKLDVKTNVETKAKSSKKYGKKKRGKGRR